MASIQKVHQTKVQKPVEKKTEKIQKSPVKKAQVLEAPETLRPEEIRAAQQEVGNQVVQRALDKHARPASLTDEQGNLRRDLSDQIQQKRGSGSPLPDKVREEASQKLGGEFKDVHIHTDETADKLSRSIHARAFTIGKDVFFKNGAFAPASTSGRETILHELTHVVQQSGKGSASGKLKLGAPDTAHEKQADQIGKKFSSAVPVGAANAAHAGSVQAQSEEEEAIQGQPDRGVVQAIGEEEEEAIQGQPESVIQREGPDEEEPVTKPTGPRDAPGVHAGSGVSQPEQKGDTKQEKASTEEPSEEIPPAPKMTPKMQLEAVSQAAHNYLNPPKKPSLGARVKSGLSSAKRSIQTKVTGVDPESMQAKIKAQTKKMKHVEGGLAGVEKTQEAKFKKLTSTDESGKTVHHASNTEKSVSSRDKLMGIIENAKSKPEDVKAAQEKLNVLHKRSFSEKAKGFFSKKGSSKEYAEQAQERRRKNLMAAAHGGDESAFKELKEMDAEQSKNSVTGKIKGAIGGMGGLKGIASKVGGMLGGLLGSGVKDRAAEYKSHFMGGGGKKEDEGDEKGKKDEKDEPEEKGSGKSSGSSMGAGIGAMMEKYGELVKENMTLKQKVAELESGKKPA